MGTAKNTKFNSRATFNKSLEGVAWLSKWSDNTSVSVHLVGWQGSGHDTLYPSLDRINPNVGTRADLERE